MSIQLGEMSPDGRYRWDGHTWQLAIPEPAQLSPQPIGALPARVPEVQHVEMRAGAAFRMGFFAFFGAGCASLAFWVVLVIGVLLLGAFGVGLGSLVRRP